MYIQCRYCSSHCGSRNIGHEQTLHTQPYPLCQWVGLCVQLKVALLTSEIEIIYYKWQH